jgi:hypothetical protein
MRLANGALYLAIYSAAHVAFRDAIFPTYSYMGFRWNPSLSLTVVGGLAATSVGLALPARGDDFRSLMLHVMALFPVVPMSVLLGTSAGNPGLFACALIGTCIALAVSRLDLAAAMRVRLSPGLGMTALAVAAVASVFWIYRMTSAFSFDLSMGTIYANRAAHQSELSGTVEYAHMAATRTLVPLLIVAALVHRRWVFVFAGVVLELMIFSVGQHRTALFAPVAVLAAYWLAQREYSVQWLLTGTFAAVIAGWIWSATTVGFLLNEFVVRRVFFIPAMLNYEYYELIAFDRFVWWSDSKLTLGLAQYPYSESVPYLIGARIGLPNAHANAGWVGSGYMHAGWLGVLSYALLIGLLLALLNDRRAERRDRFGAMAFFVSFLWIFMSSDLPSVMLTHGMLLGIVLFHMLAKLRRQPLITHGTALPEPG